MTSNDCVFCRIINGATKAEIVFENSRIMAIKDISPKAPIHYLFFPKKHIISLAEMAFSDWDNRSLTDDENTIAFLFRGIHEVSSQLSSATEGFRTVINTGPWGGQTVFHIHIHLLAGKQHSHSF